MVSSPLLTVGIPFYNSQDTLLDSIKSIFAQTFTDWELILLDDGSTDKSLQIAKSIDDPRVRVISDGCNKKLPARLNQIIEIAQGQYIARMDADDICSPERIRRQLDLLQADNNLDAVGTGIIYLDANDVPLGQSSASPRHEEICGQPYRTFGLCHASVIAKKSWYEKHRYDETIPLGQDFNLFLRAYKESKFGNVPDPLYYYRLKSMFNPKRMVTTRIGSVKFIYRYCRSQGEPAKALYYGGMQLVKLLAGIVICTISSREKYLARRYQPLTKNQLEFYQQEIRKIKNTEIPTEEYFGINM